MIRRQALIRLTLLYHSWSVAHLFRHLETQAYSQDLFIANPLQVAPVDGNWITVAVVVQSPTSRELIRNDFGL